MNTNSKPARTGARLPSATVCLHSWSGKSFSLFALVVLAGCAGLPNPDTTPLRFSAEDLRTPEGPAGPKLRFAVATNDGAAMPITDFLYFLPLISPYPVTLTISPSNMQLAVMRPAARRIGTGAFTVEYEFDLLGQGWLLNQLDHAPNVARHEQRLRDGGALEKQLDSILVDGGGSGAIEIEGTVSNDLARVTEVRMRFNAHGKPSPVSITVGDIRWIDGAARMTNEHVARVNTIFFRPTTNVARMGVGLASIRRKDAGGGLFSKFGGLLAGTAANIFLKPIRVDPEGHATMLRFGAHLAAGEPEFTFPRAKQLKTDASAR